MTRDEIRDRVIGAIAKIAPEADLHSLIPNVSVREQLDIDSMDFLNFAISIHDLFGLDIPERDYPKLLTIDGCVEYVAKSMAK